MKSSVNNISGAPVKVLGKENASLILPKFTDILVILIKVQVWRSKFYNWDFQHTVQYTIRRLLRLLIVLPPPLSPAAINLHTFQKPHTAVKATY